jgi:hypothetical protein
MSRVARMSRAEKCQMTNETFRYDLASPTEPRIILITDLNGKRSTLPRLSYVVLPSNQWRARKANRK